MRKKNSNQCEALSLEFLEELQSLQIFGGEGEGTLKSKDQCTYTEETCVNKNCGCTNTKCDCPNTIISCDVAKSYQICFMNKPFLQCPK